MYVCKRKGEQAKMTTNSLFSHVSNTFESEGKQYFLNSETELTFSEASTSCKENGLELLTVSNVEEFNFIREFEIVVFLT